MRKAIPYYRVSTTRQGKSGLGLDAQKSSVHDFARSNQLKLGEEFTEIESGRSNRRPVLKEALEACRKEKAILIIAKLDRLSRNVAFIANLIESKVEFRAVDNPYINPQENPFILHILAAVAQYERQQISKRTKDALKAAKNKGVRLGINGSEVLSKQNKKASDDFAKTMIPVIRQLEGQGYKTIRSITDALNERKIVPFSGSAARWHTHTVYCILKRIKNLSIDTV